MISTRYRAIGADSIDRLPQANRLPADSRHALRVVSRVLPFRVNKHVTSTLIDWDNAPDDPIFRLVFPARDMLEKEDFARLEELIESGAPDQQIAALAGSIREGMNPHPSGQREHNVPRLDGEPVQGFQHKYRETLLYFPARGQTCHAYCTFCFRWAQFIGDTSLKFASKEVEALKSYLRQHHGISDVLITGGDPMIMATRNIARLIDPLLVPEFEHVQTIRIGTKSLTFWPQRFVSDPDADDFLRLVERATGAGRNVAIMAHLNHWREIDNPVARTAIRRLRDAGAVIFSQAPLLAGINDDANVWARSWREQVRMGIHPYYMFAERDTGPRHYFEVPLAKGVAIYREAIRQVSGLARSASGLVMSADPGKVQVLDVQQGRTRDRYLLQFLQARNPELVRRPFWAEGPREAFWLDDLDPIDNSVLPMRAPQPMPAVSVGL